MISFVKNKKGFLLSFLLLALLLSPVYSAFSAVIPPLVPCGNANGANTHMCGFNDIITLIKNVINFITLYLAFPVATLAFMYVGFLYLTSGDNEGKRKEAKEIATGVAIGFGLILGAWLIVHTITDVLLKTPVPFLGN